MGMHKAFETTFWLTQGVARAMGVSLTEALADGRLDRQGYAMMVAQCRLCPHSGDCQRVVAAADFVTRGAPSYCRNRSALNEIALRG